MKAVIALSSEQETIDLAKALLPVLAPSDHIFLTGDLGAGKSAFARALIQAKMATSGYVEDVPSPSFTLVQTYEFDDFDIWHIDLYRLANAELDELGLSDALEDAVMIVEWPDRLQGAIKPALSIELSFREEGGRIANVNWHDNKFTEIVEGIEK